ncbi:MAG: PH domain-containing protein [Clostridia bacterium]
MRQLEKKFSKSERVIARARFTYWVFLRELLLLMVLGGLIAVLWFFAPKIEGAFTKVETVQYLTEQNLKWAMLGAGCFVILCALLHFITLNRKEFIVTENNVVCKMGVLSVKSYLLPISGIKIVQSEQNIFQRFLQYGNLIIISDAEKPYVVKYVIQPEKLAQKIIKQVASSNKRNGLNNIKLALVPSSKSRR